MSTQVNIAPERRNFLTREAYINPSSPEVTTIVAETINAGGYFEYRKTANGDWSVDWTETQQRNRDFKVFDTISDFLWATKYVEDEEFASLLVRAIEGIVDESPLFRLLANTYSATSSEHTVLQHIFEVLKEIRTQGMNPTARFLLRLEVLFHDLGKSIAVLPNQTTHVIKDDFMQIHAALSARIWREYALSRGLGKNLRERVEQVIAYHHGLEVIDKNIITIQEFYDLLPENIIIYLCHLAVGDVYAAHPGGFDMDNVQVTWNLLHSSEGIAESDEEKATGLIIQFFPKIIESTVSRIQSLERETSDKALKLRQKLEKFINFLLNLPIVEKVQSYLLSVSQTLPHGVLQYAQT